jgi:tetratricopeptide (TPR) repeat protein
VRANDLSGQAASLNQLGELYGAMDRQEEAVTSLRQAAEAYAGLKDLANEGKARNNLADWLIKLRFYDEARKEVQRALECKKSYGHASMPWTTWAILENLELTTGYAEAAQAARQQAIKTYLAYRRAGGVSQNNLIRLFELVSQAIQQHAETKAREGLDQLAAKSNVPISLKDLIGRLQSVLAGDRNPALATDPELNYGNAAELQLLLESLEAS